MNEILRDWLTERPDLNVVGRDELYTLFERLGLDRGAEIGVEGGTNAVAMLEANPRLHLLCVDPWVAYSAYQDYRLRSRLSRFYRRTKANLTPYASRVTIVRAFSMEAVRDVPEGSLDWVYIDGNHEFDWVMEDIIAWSRRVRSGGIVSGHDYTRIRKRKIDVIDAVTAYCQAHAIHERYVVGGQCEREQCKIPPSWFWVKP